LPVFDFVDLLAEEELCEDTEKNAIAMRMRSRWTGGLLMRGWQRGRYMRREERENKNEKTCSCHRTLK
jgi:hypothetical protein